MSIDSAVFAQIAHVTSRSVAKTGICALQVGDVAVWDPLMAAKLGLSSLTSHPFGTLTFGNGLQDRNSDFSRLNGDHFPTLFRNLVRFGSVNPKFAKLDYVGLQQAFD